jgi:hypothetical protein
VSSWLNKIRQLFSSSILQVLNVEHSCGEPAKETGISFCGSSMEDNELMSSLRQALHDVRTVRLVPPTTKIRIS